MRRSSPLVALLALILWMVAVPRAHAQESAVRFEITGVADSTFSFAVGAHDWLRAGQRGIVVDPRRRDALVARFRIQRVQGGLATAVVTGQTTALSREHAALVDRPAPAFFRQPVFWIGLVLGGVAGYLIGS